eukprot:3715518-Amphidinium_carterae.1
MPRESDATASHTTKTCILASIQDHLLLFYVHAFWTPNRSPMQLASLLSWLRAKFPDGVAGTHGDGDVTHTNETHRCNKDVSAKGMGASTRQCPAMPPTY